MCNTENSGLKGRKIKRSFIEKTIDGFSQLLIDDFYAEKIAGSKGLMQGLHPGVKVLTTLMFILVVANLHSWPALILFNLWALLLAGISAVPMSNYLKRVWLVVPLFTGTIAFPSIFNILRDGDPLFVVFNLASAHHLGSFVIPQQITVTRQGLAGAFILILRVGACVSLSVLLTLSTRWEHLLRGFKMVRVPDLFIKMMEMTYRYIYVLLNSANEMFMARKSRTVGRANTLESQKFIGSAMGALWARSVVLSDEVHAAMISRGYRGTSRTSGTHKVQTLDWVWLVLCVAVSILFITGDRFVS